MKVSKKVPDIKGMKIDEAVKVLKKEEIKYNEDYYYKASMFKRSGVVLKTDPEIGEKVGTKKLDIYVSRFIPVPLLFLLALLITMAAVFINAGNSKLNYMEYRSPFIVAEKDGWVKSNVVYVTKDASLENIEYYEYCIRQDDDKKSCEWKRTDTKSIEISATGIWNVWFRAVNDKGEYSFISNKVVVYIDNEAPNISGELEVEIANKKVTVHFEAKDDECGLESQYYSLDGKKYYPLVDNIITGLKPKKEYTIYIKIVDCAGNEKIITKKVKTDKDGKIIDPLNPENPEDEDDEIPQISLRDVPSVFEYGSYYELPSWYKFGPSGGTVECVDQNKNVLTDTSKLPIGDHTITCTANGNNGLSAVTSKKIRVDYQKASDEEWDGWVILNLYYPEKSTNRMWRLKSISSPRDGSYGTEWQPYVGPIRVRIEDVGNIYIKYDLNGSTIIEQQGSPVVDINPEEFSVYDFDTTYVTIEYDKDAETKLYRLNGGEWQEYTEGFYVSADTLIEAKVTKIVDDYDPSTGEVIGTKTISNLDSVYIEKKEYSNESIFGRVEINISSSPRYLRADNKSTVYITYQSDAENKKYRINGGAWQDYTEPFEVPKDTLIEASATAKRSVVTKNGSVFNGTAYGYDWDRVFKEEDTHDYKIMLNAKGQIDVTQQTGVYVSTDRNLQELWYQVNGGEWISAPVHSGSRYKLLDVDANTTVAAKGRYKDIHNNEIWDMDVLTVGEDKNGLRFYIDAESNIPYGTKTTVKLIANYPTNFIKYRLNGGEWKNYTGQFKVKNNTYIEAITEKDNSDGTKQTRYVAKYVGTALLRVNILAPSYLYQDQHSTAKITANYSSSKLYYSFDGTNWTKYTKDVDIKGGDTIYAKAEYTDPDGILRTDITSQKIQYVNGLAGPTITANKTGTTSTPVTITLTTSQPGDIYYSINNGTVKRYEEPFIVNNNCHIKAYYIRKQDGLRSKDSYYNVSNIRNSNKPTVIISASPNPYTSTTLSDSVSVKITGYDYDLMEYSFDDVYYQTYKGGFNVTSNVTVYARARNINGYAYDQLVINNVNPIKPTNLTSEISIDPNGQNKYGSVNEVKVTLTYDQRAVIKKYKIGSNDTWHDYIGPFNVTKNTTIYLYEANNEIRGTGTNKKKIDFLPTGLTDPEIVANPVNSVIASDVGVQIDYDVLATVRKYSIDAGPLIDYTEPFNISKNNTTIYAYSEDINGNIATSSYTITNIHSISTVVLDKGKYYLIKLNYPTTSLPSSREYRYKPDGSWKLYPTDGILLIKPQYKDELIHDDILVIKIIDDNGNEVEFHGDWYVMDDSVENILADIGIRWKTESAPTPIITGSTTDWTSSLKITIDYVETVAEEKYKIVYKDGRTTGWLDYAGPFNVTENGAIIYAKSKDFNGVWSKEANYKVTNVDENNPGLRYINVMSTTTGTIKVSIDGLSNSANIEKYYYSLDNKNFKESTSKFNTFEGLTSDTVYTIYAYVQYLNGKKSEVYNIDAKTNQLSQPVISFTPALNIWSNNKTIFINHVDSMMPLYYSFDKGKTWNPYVSPITVEHNCSVMAKASDGINTSQTPDYDITTIDDTKPIITSVIYAPRTSRLIVNASANDPESNIDHYLYSVDGINYSSGSDQYSISDLKSNTDYTIYVKAVNGAGTESDVYTLDARTNDIEEITYTLSDPNTWTYNKTVTITYPKEIDGSYVNEYSLDNGNTWIKYTKPILIEAEDVTIVARLRDGSQNTKVASSLLISNIDRTIPTIDMSGIPDEFDASTHFDIPTSHNLNYDKSGGTIQCVSNLGGVHTDSSTLPIGGQTITCTATTGAGQTTTVTKTIRTIKWDTKSGDSILKMVEDSSLASQYYNFNIQNGGDVVTYPVHMYVLNGDQTISSNTQFGDWYDVASGTTNDKMAKNMVIVKVNGDLTIDSGVTVGPYYDSTYGGPKGFMIYVTGKLTNNGTIDNSHGAFATGEDVLLWKNSITNDFEYVPAVGATGGAAGDASNGRSGNSGTGRQTAGGGTSGNGWNGYVCAGGTGSSYSGGAGGGQTTAGSSDGGAGGSSQNGNSYGSGGAGNPGGPGTSIGGTAGANGTGGLLIIYSNEYENNGSITALGKTSNYGDWLPGGSSGGGSINIFTNQSTGINSLGTVINTKYNQMKGNTNASGGPSFTAKRESGAGGTGTVNIGEIRNGQYYDLKDIIQQDLDELNKLNNDGIIGFIADKKYTEEVNVDTITIEDKGVSYPAHVYYYEGSQNWTTSTVPHNGIFGDSSDIGTNSTNAQRMVVVKVKGDLTIGSGVTIKPYSSQYGGPKGFALIVTGTLINNGKIDNSHGAKASGEDVYLWKNQTYSTDDDKYEFVPATGGVATGTVYSSGNGTGQGGITGNASTKARGTGGGGSGGTYSQWGNYSSTSGAGGAGTSYSGGTGGGGACNSNNGNAIGGTGSSAGAAGGQGSSVIKYGQTSASGGGAGNPGGMGQKDGSNNSSFSGPNGTGGLLIIYASQVTNSSSGQIIATGTTGGGDKVSSSDCSRSAMGGSSGGGSINIFYSNGFTNNNTSTNKGILAAGGTAKSVSCGRDGGAGGTGSVTIGSVATGTFVQSGSNRSIANSDSTNSGTRSVSSKLISKPQIPSPAITIDTVEFAESKTISIEYPEGYTNEYSLDLGKTWKKYNESITINKETTIFARALDGDGNVVSASTFTIDQIDTQTPKIELKLKDEITVGDDISLPTGYTSTKSGVTYSCKIGEEDVTTTKDLIAGEYDIICTITNGVKKTSDAKKHIVVKEKETKTTDNKETTNNSGKEESSAKPEDNSNKQEGSSTKDDESSKELEDKTNETKDGE